MISGEPYMNCPKCGIWEIKKEDIFCGYCGERLFNIIVYPDKLRIYEGVNKGILMLKNKGCFPLEIRKIRPGDSWIEVSELSKGKLNLVPDENYYLEFIVHRSHAYSSSFIRFDTSAGSFKLDVMYLPFPEIRIFPSVIEIKNENTAKIILKLAKGREILINNISISFQEVKLKGKKLPFLWISDELECLKLSWEQNNISDSKGKIFFGIEGIEKTLEKEISFKKLPFPELKIKGVPSIFKKIYKYEKYVDFKREEAEEELRFYPQLLEELKRITEEIENETKMEVGIENTGEETLKIDRIDSGNLPLNVFSPKKKFSPGEESKISFQVEIDRVDYGLYEDQLKIYSNAINSPSLISVIIEIAELPDLPEASPFLGLDFGTTNSTVAFRRNVREDIETIRFDKNKNYISSSIQFDPVNKGYYSIGEDAHTTFFNWFKGNIRDIFKQEVNAVSFIKKYLTQNKKIRIVNNLELYPKEIAALTIKLLLIYAERYLKVKAKKAVIGVPTKFSVNQIDQIKSCCLEAGLEEVEVLDESTAAGISFVGSFEKQEFTMIVYDFGGGTTDISLLAIKKKKYETNVEVLGLTGERDFGGEEVTRLILKALEKKVPSSDSRDKYGKAESIKLELSEKEEVEIQEGKYFRRDELDEILREKFEKIMESIKFLLRKCGLEKPDIFLLSGLSSKIPLLHKIIKENFSGSIIAFSRNEKGEELLKECVAQGCVIFREELSGIPGSRTKVVNLVNKSPTSIGFLKRLHGKFIFNPVIPWGGELNKPYDIPNEFVSFKETNKIVFLIYESFKDEEVPINDPNCVKLGRVDVNLEDLAPRNEAPKRELKFTMTLKKGKVLVIEAIINGETKEYEVTLEDVF